MNIVFFFFLLYTTTYNRNKTILKGQNFNQSTLQFSQCINLVNVKWAVWGKTGMMEDKLAGRDPKQPAWEITWLTVNKAAMQQPEIHTASRSHADPPSALLRVNCTGVNE